MRDAMPERAHDLGLPATPAGRQLSAFLAALNAGDRAIMQQFMETTYDLVHLGSFIDAWHKWCGATLYHKTEGLQPQCVEESMPHRIAIRAQPRVPVCTLPAGLRVTLEVADETPHRITSIWAWPDPPSPDRAVELGGRRLAYAERGTGQPTVVLEAGLGWTSDAWAWVMDGIAQFAHVVSYDRAGIGASDSAPTPRTAADVVADLQALLVGARASGPYILVGHSIGGLFVRLYADRYPAEVAGVVLVDATHPDRSGARELGVLPAQIATEPEALTAVRQWLLHDKNDPNHNPERLDWSRSEEQVRATTALGTRPLETAEKDVQR